MASVIPLRLLVANVCARLDEIDHVTVYLRRVGYILGQDADIPPPTISATDLRVRPYVVVYPSPGVLPIDARLDDHMVGRDWTVQATCVAGDETALDLLTDAVDAKLGDWRPTPPAPYAAVDCGRMRPPPGFDPGPSRRDVDVTPDRYYTPLQYRCPIYA